MFDTVMHAYGAGCLVWLCVTAVGWGFCTDDERRTLLLATFGWPVVGIRHLIVEICKQLGK